MILHFSCTTAPPHTGQAIVSSTRVVPAGSHPSDTDGLQSEPRSRCICFGVWDLMLLWMLEFGMLEPSASADPFPELPALQTAFEILDRLHNSFLELHLRFPTEHFLRARNVRLANLGIVHRQRLVCDLRFRSGDPDDLFGE